jgi:uncharacterized damage-inducible protein DinB
MNHYTRTIFELVEYEITCNLTLLEFLADLPEEKLHRDFGFGLRTPHRTIFHIADVLQGWSGCVGPVIKSPLWLTYDESRTIGSIREMFLGFAEAWLTSARLSHEQKLLEKDGRLKQVFHIVTHGTHHRGQLLSMVTLMGYPQPIEGGDFGGWVSAR